MSERLTLLYDGDCGFCRLVLGFLLARDRDGRLRPVALQDDRAAELLPGMSESERLESVHIVDEHGAVHSGGRALPPLASALPGGAPVGTALAAIQPATDLGYELVSGARGWLGPRVPDGWKRRAEATIRRHERDLASKGL